MRWLFLITQKDATKKKTNLLDMDGITGLMAIICRKLYFRTVYKIGKLTIEDILKNNRSQIINAKRDGSGAHYLYY